MSKHKPSSSGILPWDAHNQELIAQVRPPDWINPKPAAQYDLVVLGAGTAGLVTAAGAAGLGARVALVEKHLLGGDCLNVGCVPSKALISSARRAAAVREAPAWGVAVAENSRTDFGQVMERMRRLRAAIAPNDSAARFRDLGVDVFLGAGHFEDERSLAVAGETLHFKRAVIATGARASAPPITGLDSIPYLTNETVFSLTERPQCFGILGAGPIGCEMAQTFARLGSKVFLVETAHGLLPREDREAAAVVRESLTRDGVTLLCCGKELNLSREDGGVRLRVESHGEKYSERVDQLLVAVGRAPNVEDLGLEDVGVSYTPRGVTVDDHLRTSNPRIFAAGDVCSPYRLTHAADFMARIVIQNALFFGRAKTSTLTIPWATYTDPELARVGLHAQEAEAKGIAIDTFTQAFRDVDRSVLEGQTEGFVRIHVKRGCDRIVGATLVGAGASNLISEITLAMTHNLGLKKIASTMHPYPTQADAIRRIGDQYNRTRLTPRTRALLKTLIRWRR